MKVGWLAVLVVALACGGSGAGKAAPTPAAEKTPADEPYVREVAALVVGDLASNAFGNQKITDDCVAVDDAASATDEALVVAARLEARSECGKSDLLWVFRRDATSGTWTEEFLGPAPKCWKGVPDAIADAVAKTSGIPRCAPG